MSEQMQIGEVADRTGLSLRTIRYYEEIGLAVPSGRSPGGFRLYTENDVARLQLIMRMKPAGLNLTDMAELIAILDTPPGKRSATQRTRLAEFATAVDTQTHKLRQRLALVEDFAHTLHTAADGT